MKGGESVKSVKLKTKKNYLLFVFKVLIVYLFLLYALRFMHIILHVCMHTSIFVFLFLILFCFISLNELYVLYSILKISFVFFV